MKVFIPHVNTCNLQATVYIPENVKSIYILSYFSIFSLQKNDNLKKRHKESHEDITTFINKQPEWSESKIKIKFKIKFKSSSISYRTKVLCA